MESSFLPTAASGGLLVVARRRSNPLVMSFAQGHIFWRCLAVIVRIFSSSLAAFDNRSMRQVCNRAVNAGPRYQHVMAIKNRVLPRVKTSLRMRATQDAANIAGGKASGSV